MLVDLKSNFFFSATTPKTTVGPDDLITTDYIIIGVTCGVFAGIMVGGLAFCMKNKSE